MLLARSRPQVSPGDDFQIQSGSGNQTSQASVDGFTVTEALAVGSLVMAFIACDNAGASGASAITNVTDARSNTYSQIALQNRTAGSAANDGLTVACYASIITTAMQSGDAVTWNFSPNVTAKAWARVFAHPASSLFSGYYKLPVSVGTAAGSGATYSLTTSSLAIDDLLFAFVGNESNTVPATDTDTTGGTWSGGLPSSSGGTGGDATKMASKLQAKAITAAGTQTFNGNNGATTDWAALAVVTRQITVPQVVLPSLAAIQSSVV